MTSGEPSTSGVGLRVAVKEPEEDSSADES